MTDPGLNYSEAEIQRFSALADEWWNPKGRLKTLHVINPVRLNFITSTTDISNKRILDVGCGGGLLCEALAKQAGNVTGIDFSKELIEVASRHAKAGNLNITYRNTTVEQYSRDTDTRFDVITCMEMLEHVPDPATIIRTMSGLLNPGGHLFLSTINRTLKSYLGIILGAEYILRLLPRHTHQYSQFIRPSELYAWLTTAGLELKGLAGINYIPGLDYAALTPAPTINYIVHAVMPD